MNHWNLEETRQHVARLYGRNQLELAKPCIQSIFDRQMYARIHYQDACTKIDAYVQAQLQDTSLLEVTFGGRDEAWEEFNIFVRELGAHLTACIQSMHALPDILAHVLYYSLGLNIAPTAPKSRDVGAASMMKLLRSDTGLAALNSLLADLINGSGFVYLSALANQAKHRSIVLPSLSEDWAGERNERHMVIFPAFSYGSACYPQVFAGEFLKTEHERCSGLVVEIGSSLNALLRNRVPTSIQ